ncbi:unnamed protein product, partial [Adineta steineri]
LTITREVTITKVTRNDVPIAILPQSPLFDGDLIVESQSGCRSFVNGNVSQLNKSVIPTDFLT